MITAAIVMPAGDRRGGAELMLRQLLEANVSSIRWIVIFLQDGDLVAEVAPWAARTYIVRAGRVRQLPRLLATVVRLARIFRRERCDIVVSWMTKSHLYASPAARMMGVRAVLHQLGLPEPNAPIDRVAAALPTSGVIVLAEHVAELQRRHDQRHPVRIVPPGVDLTQFDPGRVPSVPVVRRELGLDDNGPVVGIVGRLQEWKGMHVLIEAMPRVLERHGTTTCLIVGGVHELEPDYPRRLEQLIVDLDIGEHVWLVGLQRDVVRWMQAMDVVVHASDVEPFGIVVLEAMALAKPVIAGAQGGPAEVVRHDVDGILVPYGDALAMAAAITRLLDDPKLAAQMAAKARARAEEFSTNRYARRFTSAVLELAGLGVATGRDIP